MYSLKQFPSHATFRVKSIPLYVALLLRQSFVSSGIHKQRSFVFCFYVVRQFRFVMTYVCVLCNGVSAKKKPPNKRWVLISMKPSAIVVLCNKIEWAKTLVTANVRGELQENLVCWSFGVCYQRRCYYGNNC